MVSEVERWKRAWQAEREAHQELRRIVRLPEIQDLLHIERGVLHETEYGRRVNDATLAESLAVMEGNG